MGGLENINGDADGKLGAACGCGMEECIALPVKNDSQTHIHPSCRD
jgi:hypothetical protein